MSQTNIVDETSFQQLIDGGDFAAIEAALERLDAATERLSLPPLNRRPMWHSAMPTDLREGVLVARD